MKIKKIFLITAATLILFSCIASASAGWFDISFGGNELVNKDFGDFSLDVPSNFSAEERDSLNGRDMLLSAVANNGGQISFSELHSDPKNVHPKWDDENSTLTIEFIDCTEDKLPEADAAFNQLYANSSYIGENDGIKLYNLTKVYPNRNGDTYAVAKENGGSTIVIIVGEDKDLITKMGNSVVFN